MRPGRRRTEPQANDIRPILEDAAQRRRDEQPVDEPADRAERRRVADAIFHHGRRSRCPEGVLVPFGTALGVYTFWVLLNNDARRTFGRPPREAAPAV